MENLKLFYNKIRIWCLARFTNRVKHFEIKDEKGKTHKVTTEKKLEKVCDHKQFNEIAPTMYECMNPKCKAYFQINYKVMLTQNDLLDYLSKIKDHLQNDN